MRAYRESGLLALDLVNTWDAYLPDPERLPDVAALAAFLREYEIDATPRDAHLTACRSLREALRRVVAAPTPAALAERLDALAGRLQAAPALEQPEPGRWRLTVTPLPQAPLADRLAVRAIAELARAVETYGPERIRTCAAAPCEDAFIDTSRNGTRRYCSRRCANRRNASLHRSRSEPA
jgi:predicted RNA-binding Zn ribbon-like protein